MEDEKKLVDVMLDVLAEIHEMRKGINITNDRLEKLDKQMMLNNKAIGELRLSVMKLAERDSQFREYERRITKVERTLAKNKLF
ncbi:MAG: hypothetical protein SH857_15980 [Chitinophagales bacterium]|nr:hypothetical protein [Chitinophagales bacterium]